MTNTKYNYSVDKNHQLAIVDASTFFHHTWSDYELDL